MQRGADFAVTISGLLLVIYEKAVDNRGCPEEKTALVTVRLGAGRPTQFQRRFGCF
jgi:hypothetical protein